MLAQSSHLRSMTGLVAFSVAFSVGCAGTPTAEEAQERGPLPYEVGVFLDAESLTLPPGALPESVVRYLDDGDALLQHLQDAISVAQPVVSRVVRLSSTTRAAAVREGAGLDLLLAVGFATPEEFPPNGLDGGWMSLEVFSWLFGGVPSWFVPSMLYWTDVQMQVEGLDLPQPRLAEWLSSSGAVAAPQFDWRQEFEILESNVSLADRAAILERPEDYAFTILVPPSVVKPGDPLRLSRSLTDAINAELGFALAQGLKAQLIVEDEGQPLGVAFLSPNPNRVHVEPDLDLALAIASADGVPIERLVVSRRVEGAPQYTWVADALQLEELAARLQEGGGDTDVAREDVGDGELLDGDNQGSTARPAGEGVARFVGFSVPEQLPLEPGENVVKVSLHRRDGLEAVRTMVFFH